MIFRLIKITIILSLGFLFHQLPQYNRLYLHVLRGAFYESQKTVLEHKKIAIQSKKTLREYVTKYLNHPDPDFQNMGITMVGQIERNKQYAGLLKLLKETNPFIRHFILLYHFEYGIIEQINFDPGLLFTSVGFAYYIFGCLFGFILFVLTSQIRRLRFASQKEGLL